ncbi:Sterol 3-beta-glucosyltransferase UGT80A2 [Hibiscus syriacus]|uniref:Sterol 3-beta-glucosyltransferase UGT80A2 n=1 Tax=Hibiscus syriacus TaxID=106335 RepID=A0A6A2YJT6_HIBSY|nr:Sterol 3-beta-glucosyltransferase UGT80A2 [Hibiscus syriacus]
MASSPEHRRNLSSASSSSFSVEIPVKSEQVICIDAKEMDSSRGSHEAASGDGFRAVVDRSALINGGAESSGTVRRSFSEVGTSPVETPNIEKLDSSQRELEIPKNEAQRQRNILAEEAAQIFDNNIPDQQKCPYHCVKLPSPHPCFVFDELIDHLRCVTDNAIQSYKSVQLKLLNRIVTVKNDGTVVFEVPEDVEPHALGSGRRDEYTEVAEEEALDIQDIPPLHIVMLIVGTRGDVQPFVAIGKRLQDYGHRVRLATHSNFKEFVLTAGLEFYPLGGDPKVLAGSVALNLLVTFKLSITQLHMKNVRVKLKIDRYACKDPDPDSGIPFKADAIIANPPAYGHTHVAEALKVPIHIFFTMPWTPTSEFPHPWSRVKQPAGYRLSYQIVDSMIWLGIRDMINDLRKKKRSCDQSHI